MTTAGQTVGGHTSNGACANGTHVVDALTPRENEVLALIAQGLQNKNIAAALRLSEHTIKLHIHHIISKMGGYPIERKLQPLSFSTVRPQTTIRVDPSSGPESGGLSNRRSGRRQCTPEPVESVFPALFFSLTRDRMPRAIGTEFRQSTGS
ncbi:helix-turn-helix transcriptional regulator [Roseibium salinum]|nr:helix-turn-helix transcriptional regulator [Roseibium salinum]